MLKQPGAGNTKNGDAASPKRGGRQKGDNHDMRRKLSVFGTDSAIDGVRKLGENILQVEDIPTQSFTPEPGNRSPPSNLSKEDSSEHSKSDLSQSTDYVAADQVPAFINLSMPTTNFTCDLTPFQSFAISSRVGASMRGDKVNQDRPFSCVPFNGDSRSAMFAVFDGHGFAGDANAQYLTENIERCVLSFIPEDLRHPSSAPKTASNVHPYSDPDPRASQIRLIATDKEKENEHRGSQASTTSVESASNNSTSSKRVSEADISPNDNASAANNSHAPSAQASPSKRSSQNKVVPATSTHSQSSGKPPDQKSHKAAFSSASSGGKKFDLLNQLAVATMFTKGFAKLETDLTSNEAFDTVYSGSTCVCLLMHGDTLYTANVGDSRAVLGRTKWYTKRSLKPVVLSRDHSPGIRAERRRIIEAGGRVHPTFTPSGHRCGPLRVWIQAEPIPGLAMSRSFGDELAHSVGVIAVPEIKKFEMKSSGKDKLIVLGSDGLFEFMSNSEVVNMAFQCATPAEACEKLCDTARKRWKLQEDVIDDITAIVIFLK